MAPNYLPIAADEDQPTATKSKPFIRTCLLPVLGLSAGLLITIYILQTFGVISPSVSSTSSFPASNSKLDANAIARLHISSGPDGFAIQLAQTEYRIQLVEAWDVPEGARVLELGAGQGDTTTVLAAAVGEAGHVWAVDPAPMTYGRPYTVKQAHEFIDATPLGPRITWHQDVLPLVFLDSLPQNETYDLAVISHALWYYGSVSEIRAIFEALAPRTKKILFAEWALRATRPNAQPHLLASLAQAAMDSHKPAEAWLNIRTLVSPARVRDLAAESGWVAEQQSYIIPGKGMRDGSWEVENLMQEDFDREMEVVVPGERERNALKAMKDAAVDSMSGFEGGIRRVRCMDAWVTSFVQGLRM